MNKPFKRVCALLLCLALLCTTALAEPSGLEWASGGYLDNYENVQFQLSAQFQELIPYSGDTLDMMNSLLNNLSVSARLLGDEDLQLSLCVAGEPVATLREEQTVSGTALTTSLLPNRTLVSSGSAMDALSAAGQQEPAFDLFAAIREVEGCYQALTDAILPYAEQKTASYSIKDVGSSRWSRIARLTTEQSAELAPLIAQVLGCGMNAAFREQLAGMTYQKGFIVGLYQTKKDGDDLAVYIRGNVTFPDGAQRAISYQWAFGVNSKGQRVDTYKFHMTKSKTPRDNREIDATCKRSTEEGVLLVNSQSKAVIRDPETGVTTTTTIRHNLSGKDGTMEGSYSSSVRTALGEDASTSTFTVAPSLMLTSSGDMATLSGTVHVEQAEGKTVQLSLDLLFAQEEAAGTQEDLHAVADDRLPQSSLTQNLDWGESKTAQKQAVDPPIGYTAYAVPETETTVDLDTIRSATRDNLMDEMAQRLAGSLLKAIVSLPEESAALIRDSMSQEDYAELLTRIAD